MYEYEYEAIVRRAAERLKESDGSKAAFFRITSQAARGTGVRNESDLKKITTEVRRRLSEHSANARSAKAARKRIAEGLAKRIAR